jgi:hypothetical protein
MPRLWRCDSPGARSSLDEGSAVSRKADSKRGDQENSLSHLDGWRYSRELRAPVILKKELVRGARVPDDKCGKTLLDRNRQHKIAYISYLIRAIL